MCVQDGRWAARLSVGYQNGKRFRRWYNERHAHDMACLAASASCERQVARSLAMRDGEHAIGRRDLAGVNRGHDRARPLPRALRTRSNSAGHASAVPRAAVRRG